MLDIPMPISEVHPAAEKRETLAEAIAAFLRSREAGGATPATLRTYRFNLDRFCCSAGIESLAEFTAEVVEAHLLALRARMKPVSVHQSFRTLRAFCRWCARTGRLPADPMEGMTMRLPRTLPRVPEAEDVRRLLATCGADFEGRRNRALIMLAADSGLRKEELRRLRVGDLDFRTRLVQVRGGKGRVDRVTFFGETAASALRAWLAVHPDPRPAAPVFCSREGLLLGPSSLTRILHRLSRRAGLERVIGPHALRHFAATELMRRTGDLELVRRTLGHQTLAMALRYATLTQTDIAAKFSAASPMDHVMSAAGRYFHRVKPPRGALVTYVTAHLGAAIGGPEHR